MLHRSDSYRVYTDGSCWTTDRIGSWAWVAIDNDFRITTGGCWMADTTISRMELLGPIDALESILMACGDGFRPSLVEVFSDSEYVVLGITQRSRARNKNNDLWNMLDHVVDEFENIRFEHVRGHNGNKYNEMADEIAGNLRKEGQYEVRKAP